MSRALALSVAAAFALAGCSAGPQAPAITVTYTATPIATPTPTRDESAFRVAMSTWDLDADALLAIGHRGCDLLEQGKSPSEVGSELGPDILALSTSPALPMALGRATTALCPDA